MAAGFYGISPTLKPTLETMLVQYKEKIGALVAMLRPGAKASVTLDAYGDRAVFEAVVVSVDPAETIVEGVATYTTTLAFREADERIRSGMSANVSIVTAERTNVLAIPARAVTREDGRDVVRITRNEMPTVVPVTLGVRASDGLVEIIEGVAEGDTVITTPAE